MSSPEVLRLLLLLRMIAFLAFMYLVFGWIVERATRDNPESKMRGFARLICSPLTKPIGALLGAEADYPRVLRGAMYAFGGLWLLILVASEYALAP